MTPCMGHSLYGWKKHGRGGARQQRYSGLGSLGTRGKFCRLDQQGDATTTVHAVSLWSSSRRVLRLDDTPMTGVDRSSDGDLHETPPRPAARLPSLAGANGAASSIRRFADVWTGGGELMPAFSTSSAAAAGAAHSWCARLLRGSASAALSGKTSFGACAIVLERVSGEKVHWMRVHV